MTFYRFRLLRPRAQLLHVFLEGVYLAKRWQQTRLVTLYYLADDTRGFFAEVGLDESLDGFAVLRTFRSNAQLVPYTVSLPELY